MLGPIDLDGRLDAQFNAQPAAVYAPLERAAIFILKRVRLKWRRLM